MDETTDIDVLGYGKVSVVHEGTSWIVAYDKRKFILNEKDLTIRLEAEGTTWDMLPADGSDVRIRHAGKERDMSLLNAGNISFSEWRTGFSGGVQILLNYFNTSYAGIEDIVCK